MMAIFSPFKRVSNSIKPFFDDSNRVARIIYRFSSYRKLFASAFKKGIPAKDLIRSQFPFVFSDSEHPPIISLEFTNYCNLKCPYCTSPLGIRDRGYMSDELITKIVFELKKIKPNRIQIIGNGESTLHPKFNEFIKSLAATNRYISIVTNGQWVNKEVAYQMISAPLDLIEFSIDVGGKEGYENSRINGKFDTLVANLTLLKKLKSDLNSKTTINIRLMVRPSQMAIYKVEVKFWKQFADRVMPQYITKINNTKYENDIYIPVQVINKDFPKCSMPFKHMEIKWTGEVLMCCYTAFQVGYPGLVIGNVMNDSILNLWNCETMKQYRLAHRKRLKEKMPVCEGCPGT